jgi:hypothetical protein
MENLSKEQLIGIIVAAQNQLEVINKVEEKNKPIKGKKTVAYYCQSAPLKKWKVEFMGNHVRWCETSEEVKDLINILESK